ncbi:peptidase family C50-domain-containing protein [Lipomyces kononenkoae]|uniref:Peptidase family C50-domain-containing protein n=1 Tax=Lipomyces kononenkoae TaxID=34357 RepID=A0ACC3SXJ1_LIPKO
MAVESEVQVRTREVRAVPLAGKAQAYGLSIFNRAVHFVTYTRTVMESKKVPPNIDDFLPRVMLGGSMVQADFERLVVEIDFLRRSASKVLGENSQELIFALLSFVLHYKTQTSTPIFKKVAIRILENCIAFAKCIALHIDDPLVVERLHDCAEVSILLEDEKCAIYIANTYYNCGVHLCRTSRMADALSMWRTSIELHRRFLSPEQLPTLLKKLERLAMAHVELKNFREAAVALTEAIAFAVQEVTDKLCVTASVASLSAIASNFPEIDRLLTMYVHVMVQCNEDAKFPLPLGLEAACEGIILEWILRILVASRKAAVHRLVEAVIVTLYDVYGEDYPIRYARSVVSVLPLAIENDNKEQALKTAENVVNRLGEEDYKEDAGLANYAEDLTATCSLYIAILEYQLQLPNSVMVTKSVQLWHALSNGPDLENSIVDRGVLLSNLQLLSDFLDLKGRVTSQILTLHCLQKIVDGTCPKLYMQCYIALSRAYLGLGFSGKAAEYLRLSQKVSKNSDISVDDVTMLHLAEIEYFVTVGKLERAKERIATIGNNNEQSEDDLSEIGSKQENATAKSAPKVEILAHMHYTVSLLLMEYGRDKEALSHAKASIKAYNRIMLQKSRRFKGIGRESVALEYSRPEMWSCVLGLARSHAQVAAIYDHQGMVRETEFYLTEAVKLVQSLRRDKSPCSYQIALGDFYSRSGNLMKARELLLATMDSDAQIENHMHKAQLEMALASYYHAVSSEEKKYEGYETVEDTLLAATAGLQNTGDGETLEDMLSELTLTDSAISKSKTDEFFHINRLRATVLRLKSHNMICQEDWEQAESALRDSAALTIIPRDRTLQSMAESHFHFVYATSLLQRDPVFTVLQDSAISIPNVSRSSSKSAKDVSPSTTLSGVQTRGRKATKSSTSSSPLRTRRKDLTDVQKTLCKARQLVLESYFVASKIGSAYEKQKISNHLGQVLLLQSAIGSVKDDAYCPAANYFFELSKGLSLAKDIPAADETSLPAVHTFDSDYSHSNVLDLNAFQKEYVDIIPDHWAAVSIALLEDSEDLIVSRFQANESPFLLRLPLNRHCSRDADEDSFSFNDALSEMQDIISKSNDTAQASRNIQNGAKSEKQQWWAERRALDLRLKELLDNMEYSWLGGFKGILSGNIRNRDHLSKFSSSFIMILKKHLPTRRTVRTRQGSRLKAQEIKIDPRVFELFISLGDPAETDNSDMLEDLIYFVLDILQFHGECNAYDELDMDQIVIDVQEILRTYYESLENGNNSAEHIVLILDKTVHMFPWESLPCLRRQSISRLPSLSALRSILQTHRGRKIDVEKGAYILNPSADLVNTQNQFQSQLESFDGWSGIIARAPTEGEFKSYLNANDLVLYFGHGGGEQYIRPSQIKNLDRCAATFLLGCSSGALHKSGNFEPWGTPMNYLIAGCPLLVANLWDVTDKDIDRFSHEMFRLCGLYDLASKKTKGKVLAAKYSIGEAIAKAREICNLKYLNGAAPVLYGVPLELANKVV